MVTSIHCAGACYGMLLCKRRIFFSNGNPGDMKHEAESTKDGRPGLVPYNSAFRLTRCRSPPRLSLPRTQAMQRKGHFSWKRHMY